MEEEYKGLCVELDKETQIEFNRRKNVEQDQQLKALSNQIKDLQEQQPAGFLTRVYYGLKKGPEKFRFSKNLIFEIPFLSAEIGDAFELFSQAETENYIPAIAVVIQKASTSANDMLQIINQGDYNNNTESFNVVNMKTGDLKEITIIKALSLQPASSLGDLDAQANANKQLTVINDISTNTTNVVYASVDINNDDVYNWITIGRLVNGKDGFSIWTVTDETFQPTIRNVKIGDTIFCATNVNFSTFNLIAGQLYSVEIASPLKINLLGTVKGEPGDKGNTGDKGEPGEPGLTPTIRNGNWFIGDVDTGVKAVGVDGQDGQDGRTWQIVSGLWSVPENVGKPGNVDPEGNPLNTLPTLPRTGISRLAAIVYDPLTTPLKPFYNLYWANDNDTQWSKIKDFNGINGKDGKNGLTPYIQDNNWYIGDTNTGVPVTGPQGPQGPQGEPGPAGGQLYQHNIYISIRYSVKKYANANLVIISKIKDQITFDNLLTNNVIKKNVKYSCSGGYVGEGIKSINVVGYPMWIEFNDSDIIKLAIQYAIEQVDENSPVTLRTSFSQTSTRKYQINPYILDTVVEI